MSKRNGLGLAAARRNLQSRNSKQAAQVEIHKAMQKVTAYGTRPGLVVYLDRSTQQLAVFTWGMEAVQRQECPRCGARQQLAAHTLALGRARSHLDRMDETRDGILTIYQIEDNPEFKEHGHRAFCPDCALQEGDYNIHELDFFGLNPAEYRPDLD